MRLLNPVAAVLGALLLSATSSPVAAAMAASSIHYVALGDSAAAAPLVPDAAAPAGCLKSTNDYPSVLARRLATRTFTDATCTGARTGDLVDHSQQTRLGPVTPQIAAIDHATNVITITIGGNDVGLASAALRCRSTILDTPPCSDRFVADGVDRISAAIDHQIAAWTAMLQTVRDKAPSARIILVGYGTYIRPGGCFPQQPINPRDADYFQAEVDELNAVQRRLAAEEKVDYFDITVLSTGHDMCAAPDDRYFEGFVLAHPAAPLHPNALGATAVGNALAHYIETRG